ncbi:oxytocin receptor-like [Ptychodera flava]|uniref:oxytocin receptor-like n=1 Tax=Ptychodera flava TaxID=63121 RepID=UPI00396A3E25
MLKQVDPYMFCYLSVFTNGLLPFASGFTATLMSIERCLALTLPIYYQSHVTRRATISAVVLAMTLVVFINGMPFLGIGSFHDTDVDGQVNCKYMWVPKSSSGELVHFSMYIVCGMAMVFITVFCNVVVIRVLYGMRNKVHPLSVNAPGNHQDGNNSAGDAEGNRQRLVDHSRQVRFAKMMIVIAVAFTVCWLPWMITIILKKGGVATSFEGEQLASRMLLANHAIDPFIYVMMWKSMRRRVARAFARFFSALGCVWCLCGCYSNCTSSGTGMEIASITPVGVPTLNGTTMASAYNITVANFDKFATLRRTPSRSDRREPVEPEASRPDRRLSGPLPSSHREKTFESV